MKRSTMLVTVLGGGQGPEYREAVLGSALTLTNAGFEAGTLSGWTGTVSSWLTGVSGSVAADNSTAGEGSYSTHLQIAVDVGGATSNYARIIRTVTLPAGYYRFNFKLRRDGTINSFLELGKTGEYWRTPDVSGAADTEWRQLRLIADIASEDTYTVNFRISNVTPGSSQEMWIDDVVIEPVVTLSLPEFTVAAIGDSQVAHLGLDATVENDNQYSFLLSSIRRCQQQEVMRITPLNKGVPGDRTSQVLARINADVINATPKPRMCYVAAGTNDIAASIPASTITANLKGCWDLLRGANIEPVVFTITPRNDAFNTDVITVNAAITSAANSAGVRVFDAYAVIAGNANWSTEWMDDAVHYNYLGHLALGTSLGDILREWAITL